jgi:ethanolamine utilization protein EutQ (cupin superfamily)
MNQSLKDIARNRPTNYSQPTKVKVTRASEQREVMRKSKSTVKVNTKITYNMREREGGIEPSKKSIVNCLQKMLGAEPNKLSFGRIQT